MGLKIFDVDPSAAPRKPLGDVVGRFRSGHQVNNRPMALEAWRVTTGDPEVATALTDLFKVKDSAQPWETQGEDSLELFTDLASVNIIVEGANAVRTGMVLWGRNALIRSCDGVTQKDGTPCACPQRVMDRKEAAKLGTGCEPSIVIFFRLADAPDLGKFKFVTGSWSMAGEIGQAEDALAKLDGPAFGTLKLELVEYTTKAGRNVRYTKPVLSIGKAAPAEFAEGPFS